MDGATGSDEISTVNGYDFVKSGNPGAGSAMGGPARTFDGAADKFKLTADAQFAGQTGIPVSAFVGFVPTALSGTQIIFTCTNAGTAPVWDFITSGTDLIIVFGDGGGSATSFTVETGLVNGVARSAGFSINRVTSHVRLFVDGIFIGDHDITGFFPGAGTLFGNLGGDNLGRYFKGSIVAPTGWNRTLSDADQLAMQNGGTPWRLT